MPVTPTYPGIYIQELPSSTHTIVPAPTSITVFVGYTHPFKTRFPKQAIQIFSFTDYVREFGGLYASGLVPADVAHAVNQFFINGGSNAYVVGIPFNVSGGPEVPPIPLLGLQALPALQPVSFTVPGSNIVFTAREPTDQNPIKVTISNQRPATPSTLALADVTLAYGKRSEVYRNVTISGSPTGSQHMETVIGTTTNPVSTLVTVAPTSAGYRLPIAQTDLYEFPLATDLTKITLATSSNDFIEIFEQDSDLDKVSIFNLLVLPGVADNSIWSAALAFCERKMAFLIMDPPLKAAADLSNPSLPTMESLMNGGTIPRSTNGAIYFPYLQSTNPVNSQPIQLPPSGYVAGIYAKTDQNRGVWKAPAGLETVLLNTTGVVSTGRMTDMRQGTLNQIGVDVLRTFPGVGTVIYGARTLHGADNDAAFQQWKYVPVRRMALFIEQTLYRNLTWAVFEPNDEPLWIALRRSVENFMLSLFNQGAFQGSKPSQAFQVKCDSSTTTQDDIDNGKVNILVAFAPLKPAEFVIVQIAQLAGQAQA